MEILIFVMIALLTVGMVLTYIHADNILEATNDRINRLERDFSELDYQVDELKDDKPKEKFDVELVHYVGKEVKTTLIPNIIEINDDGYYDEWSREYYQGDKTRFAGKNSEFIVKSKNIINFEKKVK
jgi:uncharacterized protein (UPF0335 family)